MVVPCSVTLGGCPGSAILATGASDVWVCGTTPHYRIQMCKLDTNYKAKGQRMFFIDAVLAAERNWGLLRGRRGLLVFRWRDRERPIFLFEIFIVTG